MNLEEVEESKKKVVVVFVSPISHLLLYTWRKINLNYMKSVANFVLNAFTGF